MKDNQMSHALIEVPLYYVHKFYFSLEISYQNLLFYVSNKYTVYIYIGYCDNGYSDILDM